MKSRYLDLQEPSATIKLHNSVSPRLSPAPPQLGVPYGKFKMAGGNVRGQRQFHGLPRVMIGLIRKHSEKWESKWSFRFIVEQPDKQSAFLQWKE